jgi:ATP-dependent DNA helicase RecG
VTGDLALTIGRQEADNIEFKSAVVDRDKICKAICALANDLPGRGEGYLVTVPAAISPPVSFDGRVFVRVGPSTQVATPDEERVLRERRQAADLPFDQQPVPGSSMAELDLELFASTYLPAAVSPEVIRENQRTVEDQLASLRLLTPDASDPTVLGHLLIGLDPTAWIPGAYMQFVRYEGVEVDSAVQDHEELRGNLIGTLDALNRLLPANIRTAITDAGDLRQRDAPDYPLPALRELVLNALMHRCYDVTNAPTRINWFADRVEITSPGGPFGSVTAQNFDRRNDYRNPALAAALK